ncbi:transglycosylase SLT domain-containing protein [Ectothiorhodospiraceae bacterium 2226]|nr:transglycosylase SLT domain-containing protein [Ectothiorhodospiraceae bacterium 2226]
MKITTGLPALVTAWWLIFCNYAWAAVDFERLDAQRALYVQAEQALQQGDEATFKRLVRRLHDYPLLAYLLHADLDRRLYSARSEEVDAFLTQYGDTALGRQLRHRWLNVLAARGAWNDYLAFWAPTADAALQCHRLHALIRTGESDQAFAAVEPLWLVGRSQNAACDPVFEAWRTAGKLTQEQVWQRIDLAMANGQTGLASYLARYLAPDDRRWVELWRTVHQRPASVLTHPRLKQDHNAARRIGLHGVQRLMRQDAARAAEAWEALSERLDYSEAERLEMQRALALRLAIQRRAEHPLLADPAIHQADQRVAELNVVNSLRDRNWHATLERIAALAPAEADSDRWRYWRARALEALGDSASAETIYRALAGQRSYYGFLAADRLGSAYALGHRPLVVQRTDVTALYSVAAVLRAHELYRLDRALDARREWNDALRQMNEQQTRAAARLAHEWGWHDRAILTVAQVRYWDDLELRFPLAHTDLVQEHAERAGIAPAYAFAVIRQESAFQVDARSPAGAMGLMQLMPATARMVARHQDVRLANIAEVYEAPLNIRLGTSYLRTSLERFGGHAVLAAAAYNAGHHRVRQWLPAEGEVEADLWVELIPFRETRGYVQSVLSYRAIYEQRLGLVPTRLSEHMRPVQAPDAIRAGDTIEASTSGG